MISNDLIRHTTKYHYLEKENKRKQFSTTYDNLRRRCSFIVVGPRWNWKRRWMVKRLMMREDWNHYDVLVSNLIMRQTQTNRNLKLSLIYCFRLVLHIKSYPDKFQTD